MGCHVARVPHRVQRNMASTLLVRSGHRIEAGSSHFGRSWAAQNLRCGAWGVIGGAAIPGCVAPARKNAEQRFVGERQAAFAISCVPAVAIWCGLKTW